MRTRTPTLVLRGLLATALLAGGALVAGAGPAAAATCQWDPVTANDKLLDAQNWSCIPDQGDTLVFGPSETKTLQNPSPGVFEVGKLTFRSAGYTIKGPSAINLRSAGVKTDYSGAGATTLELPIGLVAATDLDVAGGTSLAITGVLSNAYTAPGVTGGASGGVNKVGPGTARLAGANTYTGATVVAGGVLVIDGSQPSSPVSVRSGATLGGTGRVGTLVVDGGGTFRADVCSDGMAAGPVTLRGNLALTGSTEAPIGTIVPALATTSRDGTFAGAAEGATVASSTGQQFRVSYAGGDGNDVVLTVLTPGSGCSTPPPPTRVLDVQRLAGADRVATGVAVSRSGFPAGDSARVVVLARSDQFADALAGVVLAVNQGGPLLVNPPAALDGRVLAEIDRVLPRGGRVVVLGGPAALGPEVVGALDDAGFAVGRVFGEDRYETAVSIAEQLVLPSPIILATGRDFPDALAAGAAAAASGGAVLLTDGATLPAATASYLEGRFGAAFVAVGGPAAAAVPEATPVVGADRYTTAVAVAQRFFGDPTAVGVASGANFPDALTGGPHIAALGGPMLLTRPDALPQPVRLYIAGEGAVTRAFVYGGSAAVTEAVVADLRTL